MKIEFETDDPERTLALGQSIGACLEGNDIVFLDGDLGAGKTLLTKGLYRGLGGPDPDQVLSPSYTMVNMYEDCDRPFYHVDLYRLTDERQLLGMEYEDFLLLNPGLTVVEWPRLARGIVDPDAVLNLHLEAKSETERRIICEAAGTHYRSVFEELAP